MKKELLQARKKLEKLDVIEGMLSTLLKGKSVEGTLESSPITPLSCNVTREPALQRTADPTIVAVGNQLVVKQIELPQFSGEDPIGWLARADQYFTLNRTPANMKVQLALFVCMDGAVLHWFR